MKRKLKQIGAVVVIIAILGLYIWAIVAAVMARPEANAMFMAAISCTIAIPAMIYVYIWVAGLLKGKGQNSEEKQKK